MFNFAVTRDWRADNPCKDVQRPAKEKSRDRVLLPTEIVKLWTAIEAQDPFHRALFRLRFLTAARGGEIRKMRWSAVDLHEGRLGDSSRRRKERDCEPHSTQSRSREDPTGIERMAGQEAE
jgi:integrase